MASKVTNGMVLQELRQFQGTQASINAAILQELRQFQETMRREIAQLHDGQSLLLSHMQGIKNDLQQQINRVDARVSRLEGNVARGFEDARLHRAALQQDLDATIRMQIGQNRAIARLQKKRLA